MTFLVRSSWREIAGWHASKIWQDVTTPSLLRRAALESPDAVAVVDGLDEYSFLDMQRGVEWFAERLLEGDVDRGDVVIVHLPDSAARIAASLAIHAVEAVAAPVSHSAKSAEIAAVVERTSARGYIGVQRVDLPTTLHEIVVERGTRTFVQGASSPLPTYFPDPDALSEIMFTSGTTGRPKGVMNSANTKLTGLRGLLASFDFSSDDVWGVVPPMSHNAGWLYSALPALATQARMVLVPRGNPRNMLEILARHRVTACFLVPAHLVDLVAEFREDPSRFDLRLRYVLTGAAAASADAIRAVRDEWGATPVSIYGMTECQANLFTRPDDHIDVIASTVGRACPGSEVAIRDPDSGALLTDGQVGEIVTRGPTTFLGYYDDQAATSNSFTKDGWFRSGDLAVRRDGNISVVGRIKEVILRGGTTIVPADIEAAIATFPGVDEVAVIGLPDARLGERVCACFLGAAPSRTALIEHLDQVGFGRSLLPDDLIQVDAFPRTELGKVQRAKLRTLVLGETGA